jgi:hypothetical protein
MVHEVAEECACTGVVDVDPFGSFAFHKFAVDDVFDGGNSREEARELGAGHTGSRCEHDVKGNEGLPWMSKCGRSVESAARVGIGGGGGRGGCVQPLHGSHTHRDKSEPMIGNVVRCTGLGAAPLTRSLLETDSQ